ncbi:MAG: B12-binding domain-containing radical SAM protein [Acidobacteriota bacterium]
MDLLLSHGYFLDEDAHERKIMRPYPPLGLLYIAAHLKQRDLEVEVFDTTFSSRAEFNVYLRRHRPPIVGLYANLMTRTNVLGMIRACKANGCLVVVGGPEPANYAEEYLQWGADVVVEGEGEVTLEELIPHLLEVGPRQMEEIDGIIYRDAEGRAKEDDRSSRQGGVSRRNMIRTPPRQQIVDLDAQPFPDRDAIDINKYVDSWRNYHGRGSVSLITARGCPFQCKWCSHDVFGFTHRRRSPENVADELQLIVDTCQPDMVWYADDVFTIDHKWIHAYAGELNRRRLKIPFETISREDRLDEAMVERLAEMGCFRLWIGSESGSQRVLEAMKRRTNAARVREMVKLLQAHGIEAGLFIMLGYDGEQVEDIEATVEHLKAAAPDQLLTTIAYPIKGTPYYDEVDDRIFSTSEWSKSSDRDLSVQGRHSQRFYRFATRWMVSEVAWYRQRLSDRPNYPRLVKAFLSARIGRVGMYLTKHEEETPASVY